MVPEDKVRDLFRLMPFDFTVCMLTLGIIKAIGKDWTFCQEYIDFGSLDPIEFADYGEEKTPPEMEADAYYAFEQMILEV